MKVINYAIVLVLSLSGCNSFNTYDPPRQQGRHESSQKKEEKGFLARLFGDDSSDTTPTVETTQHHGEVAPRDEQGRILCPAVKLRAVPPMPELPMDQLRQLGPTEKDALVKLLLGHIDTLRSYGQRVRTQENDQRARYNAECRRWLNEHEQ